MSYEVGDRVHVPGKGMGSVSFIRGPKSIAVRFDKTFRYGNGWKTIMSMSIVKVRPWACGIHSDCKKYPDLGFDCIVLRATEGR